jgi:hypothetical protein
VVGPFSDRVRFEVSKRSEATLEQGMRMARELFRCTYELVVYRPRKVTTVAATSVGCRWQVHRIVCLATSWSLMWSGVLSCHALAAEPSPAVRKALELGGEYLQRTQQPDGAWRSWGSHQTGETALAGMALVAAGSARGSDEVQRARRAVLEGISTDKGTYDISLAIMFLDQVGEPEDRPLLNQLGARLIAGQLPKGSWSYGHGDLGGGDNSNTQFAAIACWVARKHGVVDDGALGRLDDYFRNTFVPGGGGWGYATGSPPSPTMTCAGLVGLATYRGAERQRQESESADSSEPHGARRRHARDPVVEAALQALGLELRRSNQDPHHAINEDLYFYWSLERVAVIYDLSVIGGVDWYGWGSGRLIRGQSPDGQWQGRGKWRYHGPVGTSFAILFLSRMNAAADLTSAVGLGNGSGTAQPAAVTQPQGGAGGRQLLQMLPESETALPGPSAPIILDPRRGGN